jgi:hypothetical protein
VTEIALVVIGICASIAVARIAEAFLVPVVMGILLSYTLRPLVSLLERIRIPRFAAATLVIAILVSMISATAYAIRDDVNDWVAELPAAARKLRQTVATAARQSPGPMTNMKAAAEGSTNRGRGGWKPAPPLSRQGQRLPRIFRISSRTSRGKPSTCSPRFCRAAACAISARRRRTFGARSRIAGASLARRRVTVSAERDRRPDSGL